ncbi:MAG: hypothetical protein EBW68_11335, partial [Actinobacteria bacterium]|nr:hypothetical protein [Actinomycetota bacterium]
IPSRMTIGQLKETILGKVLLELGLFGDGTPFGQLSVKDICDELLKLGYESNGNELLCNGLTGEQHECSVFMGPVFYQRLKHMVNDKTHSRSIGPMVNLTRQPAEGRSRDGGLRFGEMERDCAVFSTPVSLDCGLSIKLGEMEDCGWDVLGWSEEHNGIVKATQTDFMYKGERECLEVTYEDGRKMQFTPDHPILTSNNEWVKIKDLLVNETRVKTSITNPLICLKDELKECDNWSLEVGNILLQTDTREEYLKTLAFVRIIGYILTDGSIKCMKRNYGNAYTCCIFMGHMLDVEKIVEDIKLFVEIKQTNFVSKNVFMVNVPSMLVNNIVQIPGLITGKRVNQNALLPE